MSCMVFLVIAWPSAGSKYGGKKRQGKIVFGYLKIMYSLGFKKGFIKLVET